MTGVYGKCVTAICWINESYSTARTSRRLPALWVRVTERIDWLDGTGFPFELAVTGLARRLAADIAYQPRQSSDRLALAHPQGTR